MVIEDYGLEVEVCGHEDPCYEVRDQAAKGVLEGFLLGLAEREDVVDAREIILACRP